MGKNKKDIVVITEDTRMGLKLYSRLCRMIRGRKITVVSTAAANTDTEDISGGYRKFRKATEKLISDGAIGAGTVVFLAADMAHEEEKDAENGMSVSKILRLCSRAIRDAGAVPLHSHYICIEEVLLSYKHLKTITKPVKRNMRKYSPYEQSLLNLYLNQTEEQYEIMTGKHQPDIQHYKTFLKDIPEDYGVTIENALATMLNVITKRNPDTFLR